MCSSQVHATKNKSRDDFWIDLQFCLLLLLGNFFAHPIHPIPELSLAALPPLTTACQRYILSRLNRAFFLGLNSICRRFRFIVAIWVPQNQQISTLFPRRPRFFCNLIMPEKCAKSALQILLCFFCKRRSNAQPRNMIRSTIRVYAQKLKYIACGQE